MRTRRGTEDGFENGVYLRLHRSMAVSQSVNQPATFFQTFVLCSQCLSDSRSVSVLMGRKCSLCGDIMEMSISAKKFV